MASLTVTINNIDEEFLNGYYAALVESHLDEFSLIVSFPEDNKYEFEYSDISNSDLIPLITACQSSIQAAKQIQ